MYKRLLFTILLISCSFTLRAETAEQALVNICAITKSDDIVQFRMKIQHVRNNFGLKLKDYYSGVRCNGQSILRHAIRNESIQIGKLLIKKLSKKFIDGREEDGMTPFEWASKRGFYGSPVTRELKKRLNGDVFSLL